MNADKQDKEFNYRELTAKSKNKPADNHKGCPYIVGTGFIPVRRPPIPDHRKKSCQSAFICVLKTEEN